MKPLKILYTITIVLLLFSCKRRHIYCYCAHGPDNSHGGIVDRGMRNSVNNFKGHQKACKNKEKQGFEECDIIIE